MELYSMAFLLFLSGMLIVYYCIRPERRWILLLLGSMIFYCLEGAVNLLFILVTALTTWRGSLMLAEVSRSYQEARKQAGTPAERKALKQETKVRKRRILMAVLLLNFGILAYLKYWNVIFHSSGLLLPLGISFYTFSAVGYLVDTYNEKYEAETNFFRYLLFVSWFPQLIQGPINRYDKMAPQFFTVTENARLRFETAKRAGLLFLFGALKKYAVANHLSGTLVQLFDNGNAVEIPGSAVVFGILVYSAQQYADFSGGIDMVMAVSDLFGIHMMQNFRQPYFSASLGEFWRRWHISLGAWMRDYVFYPVALSKPMQKLGKKASRLSTHLGRVAAASVANIVVFLIVGIWHGAQLHYVFWGLYNGLVIALSDITKPFWNTAGEKLHLPVRSKGFQLFRIVRTFIIVNIGWYFDRIYSFHESLVCLANTVLRFHPAEGMSTIRGLLSASYGTLTYLIAGVSLVIVLINSLLAEKREGGYAWLTREHWLVQTGVVLLLVFLILFSFTIPTDVEGFMYANF